MARTISVTHAGGEKGKEILIPDEDTWECVSDPETGAVTFRAFNIFLSGYKQERKAERRQYPPGTTFEEM